MGQLHNTFFLERQKEQFSPQTGKFNAFKRLLETSTSFTHNFTAVWGETRFYFVSPEKKCVLQLGPSWNTLFYWKCLTSQKECQLQDNWYEHVQRIIYLFIYWLKRQGVWLRAGRPGFDPGCRKGGDFSSSLHVQTGPGVHSTSYKMSTGEFLRG